MANTSWERRRLLLAALAATMLPSAAAIPSRRERTGFGIQLWMVKDILASDPAATLNAIARAGFASVELAGWPHTDRAAFAELLADTGLTCRCAHLPILLANDDELPRLLDEASAFGLTHLFAPVPGFPQVGYLPAEQRAAALFARSLSADDWRWNAERLNIVADRAATHGLAVGYHNHNIEFATLDDGTTPFALLLAHSDPTKVHFELDVGHVMLAGADPFALLADHPGRFRAAHLKQWQRPFVPRTRLDLPASSDFDTGFDWSRWLDAAQDAGIVHVFAERDNLPAGDQLRAMQQAGLFFGSIRPRAGYGQGAGASRAMARASASAG